MFNIYFEVLNHTDQNKFLTEVHYFRAFAIINVILVHTWRIPESVADSRSLLIVNSLRELFFHGSTLYFLFISGFLFYYLLPKFSTKKYFKSKFKNVISPYVFWTIISFITLTLLIEPGKLFLTPVLWLNDLFETILSGEAQTPYWYIPFICIVFFISPFVLLIPEKIFEVLTALLCFIPLLGTRTGTDLTFYQFLYFIPTYFLGMCVAKNYQRTLALMHKYIYHLIAIAVFASIAIITVHYFDLTLLRVNLKEGLYFIQKTALTFVFLYLFYKLRDIKIPSFGYFAKYSFPLFFTHYLFSSQLIYPFFKLLPLNNLQSLITASLLYAIMFPFVNLLLCILLKKIMGNSSKPLLGV
ncbi:acyltransferase family protein [Pleomorphovibrio marinus]|uniref:acyltransferase family protein n=1 Tax=Pleomorphovibrio marinus TaxID=2164132 RepID=UPI0037426824